MRKLKKLKKLKRLVSVFNDDGADLFLELMFSEHENKDTFVNGFVSIIERNRKKFLSYSKTLFEYNGENSAELAYEDLKSYIASIWIKETASNESN